jgi:small subunit ribosomal protein S20
LATTKVAPKKNLSALKRARQAKKRTLRNQPIETAIKTAVKKLELSLQSGNKDETVKLHKTAIKIISSAASKGVIHQNTASRKISRISKKVTAALAGKTEETAN